MPATGNLTSWRPPRIGMRIIKSSIVVFVCFVIYYLRGRQGEPFYSGIAAIICMQPYVGSSLKTAAERTIGTFIGGFLGAVTLLADSYILISQRNVLLYYFILSLAIIPLIYSTVLIKRPTAAALTCVVFVSITITQRGNAGVYQFALDRMTDTLIGIFVSLFVNVFRIPVRSGKSTLFVSDLDGTLLNSQGALSMLTVIKLNQMLERGAMITVATNRTPSTLQPLLAEVNWRLPVVAMNGAALYDLQKRSYENCKFIPSDAVLKVRDLFDRLDHNLFVSIITGEVQHVYYSGPLNAAEEEIVLSWRNLPGRYYVNSQPPEGCSVICLTAVDKTGAIDALCAEVSRFAQSAGITIRRHPSPMIEGVSILDIYSAQASRAAAVREMKKRLDARDLVVIGNSFDDLPMLKEADVSIAVSGSDPRIKPHVTYVTGSNDANAPVNQMYRLFYWGTKHVKRIYAKK